MENNNPMPRRVTPRECLFGFLMNVVAVLWAYFTVWLLGTTPVAILWRLIVIASDAALCVYLLFRWYRLLFRRPKPEPPAESQEGVWPPPPTRPGA